MRSRYRWFVAFVFFLFLLLHQADKLLISNPPGADAPSSAGSRRWRRLCSSC